MKYHQPLSCLRPFVFADFFSLLSFKCLAYLSSLIAYLFCYPRRNIYPCLNELTLQSPHLPLLSTPTDTINLTQMVIVVLTFSLVVYWPYAHTRTKTLSVLLTTESLTLNMAPGTQWEVASVWIQSAGKIKGLKRNRGSHKPVTEGSCRYKEAGGRSDVIRIQWKLWWYKRSRPTGAEARILVQPWGGREIITPINFTPILPLFNWRPKQWARVMQPPTEQSRGERTWWQRLTSEVSGGYS